MASQTLYFWVLWNNESNEEKDFETTPIEWPFEDLPAKDDRVSTMTIKALCPTLPDDVTTYDYATVQYSFYEHWDKSGTFAKCIKMICS